MKRTVLNMLGPTTHVLAGLIVCVWAVSLGQAEPSLGLLLAVVLFSLLPDIDSASSVIGRLTKPLSPAIEHRFGHRTLTHSLFAAAAVGLGCWLWFPAPDWWIIFAAWVAHLTVDLFVGERGIALFWPGELHVRAFGLKPGSLGELLVAALCGLALLYPLYLPQAARQTVALAAEPPTPTPTPAPLVIRVPHVYDPEAEILVRPGQRIERGQLIADLATYRRYRPALDTAPAAAPPIEPTAPPPAAAPPPAPFDGPAAQAALAQAQAALTLAEAEYNRAMQTDSEIYDKQIARARLDKAKADYEVAILRLTPAPTATPTPTKSPTPSRTPTATRLVEDDSRIYSQVTGRVVDVRLAAISGNEATVEIDVYPDPSAAPRPATATPAAPVATATRPPRPTATPTILSRPRHEGVSKGSATPPRATATRPPATPAGLVVITSTPTPENIATAAARSIQMTAQAAAFGPPTPLPAHWVTPVIITSTPPPATTATRAYRRAAALTTGTPTPLPANAQTATPTPALLTAPLATLPATPPPTPTPARLPADLLGHILFRSDRESGPEAEPLLYAYDPATGQIARLSHPWPYEAARARDRWAADGSYEVYAQRLLWSNIQTEQGNVAVDELQLHLYDHLYQTERLITQMGAGLVYDPAVSPVTGQIAFVSTESGNDEIWLIERDGSQPRQLTRNAWQWDKSPSWSPDGAEIVFYSNRTGNRQLWVMAADGSEQRPLLEWTEANDWDPVWVKTLAPPPQKERVADWRFGE